MLVHVASAYAAQGRLSFELVLVRIGHGKFDT
jgi:hypothetical protein